MIHGLPNVKFIFHSIYGFSSSCTYSNIHSRFCLLLLEYNGTFESCQKDSLTLLTLLPQFLFCTLCSTHSIVLVRFY